jgi:RimK family alpha-L-glutamate ligase
VFYIKKIVIGYIFADKRPDKEDKMFLNLSKKKGIDLVMINLSKRMSEEEFESKVKECDLIYNNTAEDFVIESLKTIEELGKRVIDNSKLFYYTEDKWMFYIKCKEHKIPTPQTILLSNNLNVVRVQLKKFGKWPVVIKRVYGTMGQFVEKADNLDQALKVINKFWRIDCDKLPMIAQEFIKSYSYRVTVIGKKIVQTAIKKNRGWKCTGVYSKKIDKFKIDNELRKILKKVINFTKINICGVDLLRKDNQWVVLEVNSDPGLDFIDGEQKKLVGMVLDFLKKDCKKHKLKK